MASAALEAVESGRLTLDPPAMGNVWKQWLQESRYRSRSSMHNVVGQLASSLKNIDVLSMFTVFKVLVDFVLKHRPAVPLVFRY